MRAYMHMYICVLHANVGGSCYAILVSSDRIVRPVDRRRLDIREDVRVRPTREGDGWYSRNEMWVGTVRGVRGIDHDISSSHASDDN